MNRKLKQAFRQEMSHARLSYQHKDYTQAFYHLERAHILGQSYVLPHTWSHWWMLKTGWRVKDWREILGQVPRILASLVISRIWVPLGNNGRASVSAVKAMPIPEDLRPLLEK